jgi:phage protein U
MYASLGDIEIDVLNGPQEMEQTTAIIYAQHNLIQGKPLPEMTGIEADVIKLKFNLVHQTGRTPERRLAELETARINGYVMMLVFENGTNWGDYVIQKISKKINKTDPSGYMTHVECEVELLEYNIPDALDAKQVAAQRYAFAN